MTLAALRPIAATAFVGVFTLTACGSGDGDDAATTSVTDTTDGTPAEGDQPDSDAATASTTATTPAASEPATSAPSGSDPAVTAAPASTAPPVTTIVLAPWDDPTGTYRAAFPADPSEQQLQAPLPDGTSIPVTAYLAELGGATAITSCTAFPDGSNVDPVPVLDAARDGALANFGGELVESDPIELQGRDGVSYRGAIGEAGAVLGRSFINGLELCQALVVGEPTVVDALGPAFLDSFQFLQEDA